MPDDEKKSTFSLARQELIKADKKNEKNFNSLEKKYLKLMKIIYLQ